MISAVLRYLKMGIARVLTSDFVNGFIKKLDPENNINGVPICFSSLPRSVVGSVFFGIWEGAEVRQALKYIDRSLPVIELGGSVGVVASHLAHSGFESKYICVEAQPSNIRVLHTVFERLNKLSGPFNSLVYHGAICYTGNYVEFSQESVSGARLSSLSRDSRAQRILVKCVTLGELIKIGGVEGGFQLISDIEGAEVEIFKSEPEALSRCVRLIIELEEVDVMTISDQLNFILSLGFILTSVDGNVHVFDRI